MGVLTVSDSSFQSEVLDVSDQYVMVDFWAEWCGPCKMLAPVIDALSGQFEGRVKMCKLDVDSNPEVAQKYAITSIPCNIVFKNGEEVDRIIGHLPEAAFSTKLEQIIS